MTNERVLSFTESEPTSDSVVYCMARHFPDDKEIVVVADRKFNSCDFAIFGIKVECRNAMSTISVCTGIFGPAQAVH